MFTGTWCSGPLACFRGQCSSCDPESFRSSAGKPPTPATPLEPTIEGVISYPGAFRVASETRVLAQRTCRKRKCVRRNRERKEGGDCERKKADKRSWDLRGDFPVIPIPPPSGFHTQEALSHAGRLQRLCVAGPSHLQSLLFHALPTRPT